MIYLDLKAKSIKGTMAATFAIDVLDPAMLYYMSYDLKNDLPEDTPEDIRQTALIASESLNNLADKLAKLFAELRSEDKKI